MPGHPPCRRGESRYNNSDERGRGRLRSRAAILAELTMPPDPVLQAEKKQPAVVPSTDTNDIDPAETSEWLQSLESVLEHDGTARARFLLTQLREKALREGVEIPLPTNTPYINTIPPSRQEPFPGSRELERRIKNLVRWNAMAMVVRANRKEHGIGGHISTYASAATLYE